MTRHFRQPQTTRLRSHKSEIKVKKISSLIKAEPTENAKYTLTQHTWGAQNYGSKR